jgi:hypothetical protein
MEVMLGRREDVEADLVGEDDELAQLVEHLLIALVVPSDGRSRRQSSSVPGTVGGIKSMNFIDRLLLRC